MLSNAMIENMAAPQHMQNRGMACHAQLTSSLASTAVLSSSSSDDEDASAASNSLPDTSSLAASAMSASSSSESSRTSRFFFAAWRLPPKLSLCGGGPAEPHAMLHTQSSCSLLRQRSWFFPSFRARGSRAATMTSDLVGRGSMDCKRVQSLEHLTVLLLQLVSLAWQVEPLLVSIIILAEVLP